MAAILNNLRNTIIVGLILALIMIVAFASVHGSYDMQLWQAIFRWMHVFFGILWIGLLYYFNFVQSRKVPDIPAELRPAISKYITPEALFWFRWSALFTVLAGLCVAALRGKDYAANVFTFGLAGGLTPDKYGYSLMGIGIYLALIMFLNVWGVIWRIQKRLIQWTAANATNGTPIPEKATRMARMAFLTSRISAFLTIPLLFLMGAASHYPMFGP